MYVSVNYDALQLYQFFTHALVHAGIVISMFQLLQQQFKYTYAVDKSTWQLCGSTTMSKFPNAVQFMKMFWKQPVPLYFVCSIVATEQFTITQFVSYRSSNTASLLLMIETQSGPVKLKVIYQTVLKLYLKYTKGFPGSGKRTSSKQRQAKTFILSSAVLHQLQSQISSMRSNGIKFNVSQFVSILPRRKERGEQQDLNVCCTGSKRTNVNDNIWIGKQQLANTCNI
ncbi:Hypothetical_protein [Hexamita inflata]|uniref:Hypothetical_protein n=1 Tax=Hexamita inflata TaxID=28002 RepID=A0AA86PWD5_9EUKA|nr:Hypothetical protein HINF_LOCUS30190 [Hexamita inflata]